jgi:hypothetical protein
MKRFQLILVIFVTLLSGCKADKEETFSFSSMLSKNEGKYYITVLGAQKNLNVNLSLCFSEISMLLLGIMRMEIQAIENYEH